MNCPADINALCALCLCCNLVYEGFYVRRIRDFLHLISADDHESGSLLNAHFTAELGCFLGEDGLVGDLCLVQEELCSSALRTGLAGEEHKSIGRHGLLLLKNLKGLAIERLLAVKLRINLSLLILLGLTVVPVLHGTVVAGDSGVNLGLLTALGTDELLACDIAVVLAHRVGGRNRIVRKSIIFRNSSYEVSGRLPVGKLLTEVAMEHSTRCVEGVKLVLHIKCLEDIVGVANGKVAGVGVIGSAAILIYRC